MSRDSDAHEEKQRRQGSHSRRPKTMHATGGQDHSQPAATPASAAGWTEVGPSMRCDGAVCGADSQLAPCAPSGAAQSVVVASAAPAPSARGRDETPTHSRDPSRSGRARRPDPRRASGRRLCRRRSTPAPPARPRSRPPWPRPRPGPAAPPRPGRGLRKGVSARTTRCPRTEEHVDLLRQRAQRARSRTMIGHAFSPVRAKVPRRRRRATRSTMA